MRYIGIRSFVGEVSVGGGVGSFECSSRLEIFVRVMSSEIELDRVGFGWEMVVLKVKWWVELWRKKFNRRYKGMCEF